jgi:hypothetical protein
VLPDQPQSALQVSIRAILGAVSAGFKALSANEKAAWEAAAADWKRYNKLGQQYDLSGQALYTQVNTYRQMDGQALDDTVPDMSAPGGITGVTAENYDNHQLIVTVTHTLTAGQFLFLQNSNSLGSAVRNARDGDLRCRADAFADAIVARAASPQTLSFVVDNSFIADDYAGYKITPLSAAYVPGVPFIVRNAQFTTA